MELTLEVAVALAYFDIAITELFRAAFGSYQAIVDRGVDCVVAEARLRVAEDSVDQQRARTGPEDHDPGLDAGGTRLPR